MKRDELLNLLVDAYEYEKGSYLEIGVDNGQNLAKINCAKKIGVDPAVRYANTEKSSSDDFFKRNRKKFDLIFIDGLHHAEQALRDLENSIKAIKKNGTIVMHDTNPQSEAAQRVPRPANQREWNGDVWKVAAAAVGTEELEAITVDTDHGLTIIKVRDKDVKLKLPSLVYEDFVSNREELLNLITVEQFKKHL